MIHQEVAHLLRLPKCALSGHSRHTPTWLGGRFLLTGEVKKLADLPRLAAASLNNTCLIQWGRTKVKHQDSKLWTGNHNPRPDAATFAPRKQQQHQQHILRLRTGHCLLGAQPFPPSSVSSAIILLQLLHISWLHMHIRYSDSETHSAVLFPLP